MDGVRGTARHLGRPTAEAVLASVGMALFAFFLNFRTASGLPALAGLILTVVAFWLALRVGQRPGPLFGFTPATRRGWALTLVGAAVGVGLGLAYRHAWRPTLFPNGFEWFVLVAVAIGAGEEVLYRGYVQGRLAAAFGAGVGLGPHAPRRRRAEPGGGNPRRTWVRITMAVVLAAAAHTVYKAALFVYPPAGIEVAYRFLVVWTLIGGVAFGALREAAGNVWPAVAAHVAFDIIAYGDSAEAPWWVWG